MRIHSNNNNNSSNKNSGNNNNNNNHSTFHQSHPSPINMESHNNNMLTILRSTVSNSDHTREIQRLEACLLAMHAWFYSNGLALIPAKTDTIVFGTHRRSQSAAAMTIVNVAGVLVKPSNKIKLLGAKLDNKLTLTGLVNVVCKRRSSKFVR